MKIQAKDLYHGAALTQIVEDPSFTALNKVDDKYGHYLINANIRLLVKYSTAQDSPWRFTFHADELKSIDEDIEADGIEFFACLVCGKETICVLAAEQIKVVIDLDAEAVQWIRVEVPGANMSMRVAGSNGSLDGVVAHNAYPRDLFLD